MMKDATNSISRNTTQQLEHNWQHWQNWCRLCAKDDTQGNIQLFIEEESGCDIDNSLADTIREYLFVNIKRDDMYPKEVCIECSLLVEALKKYSQRVHRVQELFNILQSTISNSDIASVRRYFEIDNEEREHSLLQQLLPEVNDIVARPAVTTYQNYANVQYKQMEKETEDYENIEILKQPDLKVDAEDENIEILKQPELNDQTEDEEIIEILKQSGSKAETEDYENIEIFKQLESKAETENEEIMIIINQLESIADEMVEVWLEPLETQQEEPDNILVLDSDNDYLIDTIDDDVIADDYSNAAFENSRDYYDASSATMQIVSRLQLVPISPPVELTTRPFSRKCTRGKCCSQRVLRSKNCETNGTKKTVTADQLNNTVSRRLHAATAMSVDCQPKSQPKCPICQKRFLKKSFVQIHINTKHANAEPYLCTKCGATFQPNIGIREHLCDQLEQSESQSSSNDELINEAECNSVGDARMTVKQRKSLPCTMRKMLKRK